MKKKILFLSIIFVSLFMINVNAKEVQIYFYAEGGKTSTKDFKISSDYVTYKDGTQYATYKDTDTIKTINSIKGHKFTLKKSGTYQVFGKEWYAYNDSTNKMYYFDDTKDYKVATIISKLGLTKDPYPVISMFANWDDDDNNGGSQVDAPEPKVKAKAISLKASKTTIKEAGTTNITVKYKPSNATKESITWTSSNTKVAKVSSKGVVTGIKEGTVTITAKTKNNLKATIKIKVEKINKVIIKMKSNGGKLVSPHNSKITEKSGNILLSGKEEVVKIAYGGKTVKSGLPDYHNDKYINIDRSSYIAKAGAEWNTKADGKGKSYNQKKVYKASDFCDASKKDCTVTLYVNWTKEPEKKDDIFTQNSMNMYAARYYDLKNFVKSGTGKITWSSENTKVATVTSSGVVRALANGKVNIVAKTSSGTDKIKINITTQTNNKNYNKLSGCTSMDVKVTGTPIKLTDCIPDVDLKNPANGGRHQIQGIAISNSYIYYSSPMNGAWLWESNGTINNTDEATTKKITTMYVIRVPRNGTKMEYMQIEYAGHGQGLDTSVKNSEGKEILYVNLASKFNENTSLLSDRVVRGTRYKGVGITTFTGKTNSATLRHPGKVVAIKSSDNSLVYKGSSSFKSNNKFNEKAYYNYLRSVVKNDNYRGNPETSVDEVNGTVAVRSGSRVLIYKESAFRSGKASPIYNFRIEDGGTQGDDIYGNYFYTITGMSDATIKKYDIRTGKKVATAQIDFTEFLKDNGYVSMEPEGISFNNGKLYAGIVTRPCAKTDGKTCTGKVSYNSIVRVSGI